MDERAGDSNFEPLALREAVGAAVGKLLHVEQFDKPFDILFQRFAIQTV